MFEQVEDTLKTLKQKGHTLVVATSSTQKLIGEAIKFHGFEGLFDHLLTAESVTKHKPDPMIVNLAMELTNITQDQSLIVGDSKSDIQAGKQAGTSTVLHYPIKNQRFYPRDMIESIEANYTIESFSKLIEIVS